MAIGGIFGNTGNQGSSNSQNPNQGDDTNVTPQNMSSTQSDDHQGIDRRESDDVPNFQRYEEFDNAGDADGDPGGEEGGGGGGEIA